MNQTANHDNREAGILERRKHWTCYAPHAAILLLCLAAAWAKTRTPGIILRFLHPSTFGEFKALLYGEWAAIAAVAFIAAGRCILLGRERFIITTKRLIHLQNRGRGQFAELAEVFSASVMENSASIRTNGLVNAGNIRITSAFGQHVFKGIPYPDEFVRVLTKVQKNEPVHPAAPGRNDIPSIPDPITTMKKDDNHRKDRPSFMDAGWEEEDETKPGGNNDADGRITNPLQELDSLIGLAGVKSEVRSLSNFITVQKKRAGMGLPQADLALHTVFKGNPGTGKTTVARIMASIYYETGVLPKGHLVETDRSGLVAEYVGQTAVKTNAVIDRALGGVLFVDEAYSLTEGGENDFGKEAVTTLLKRMEDDRGRFAVILAGYPGNMEAFLESNPGLRSRFSRTITFPDYSEKELSAIFNLQARKNGYTLSTDAETVLAERLRRDVAARDRNFGNARYVRNLFEKSIQNQADRLVRTRSDDGENLAVLEGRDIHF